MAKKSKVVKEQKRQATGKTAWLLKQIQGVAYRVPGAGL
jgi:hypothetical protein